MARRREVNRDPERQCLACRQRAPRDSLIRLVPDPTGRLAVDLRAKLPGRGVWVHPSHLCLTTLSSRQGALSKALRAPVRVDDLVPMVREAVEHALLDGLSLAAASGALVGGFDQLIGALSGGSIAEVVLASDAASRTADAIRRAVPDDTPVTVVALNREALGQRIGSGTRAAVGVLSMSASAHLRRQLRRLRRLG